MARRNVRRCGQCGTELPKGCGEITVDYERELAQLDERGDRQLRARASDDPAAGL